MHEITINLHIHSKYSDGSLTHKGIAQAAIRSNLDAIIITDHNIYTGEKQGYYQEDGKKVLVLVGEEIHNPARQPQKSHLLVFGANTDLAEFSFDPQTLIDKVIYTGGICFLAHPYDPVLPAFGEGNISWADWGVSGYTGIELWNGFSELKVHVHHKIQAIFYAFFPTFFPHQPPKQTIKIWDKLLSKGKRVVAIGGSDSHANRHNLGIFSRTIFPYEFHFSAVNTHLLVSKPLTGNVDEDSNSIIMAMRNGSGFIGYDLPLPTKGFRFWLKSPTSEVQMGEETHLINNSLLNIHLPALCDCRLIRNGEMIKYWHKEIDIQSPILLPGVYRVECYRRFLGRMRGWIFSNPIYIN